MITHVAILVDGKVYRLPSPNRHHHVIKRMIELKIDPKKGIQGFTDEQGKFYTREEAWDYAIENKQTFYTYNPANTSERYINKNPSEHGTLFLEDVW